MRREFRSCLLAACLGVPVLATGFPNPKGSVNDFAGILQERTRQTLEREIAALEQQTSAEIAIVTVASLEGESVELFANKLFKQWGIGKMEKDNGILILIAPQEHRVRIEVGYGLEAILPDGRVGDIIRQQMTPAFKAGDFDRGVKQGAERVITIIQGKPLSENDPAPMSRGDRIGMTTFIFFMIIVGSVLVGAGFGAKTVIQLLIGVPFLGVSCFIAWALMGSVVQGLLAAVAVILFLLGYRTGRPNSSWGFNSRKSRYYRAWSFVGPIKRSRGSSGSSSDSSSDSSGGSSFGGGSSGGGGASGSW